MTDPFALVSSLFDSLPVGLIALDRGGRVVIYNQAEEHLANRKRADVLGREFFIEVAPCMNVQELAGEFYRRVGKGPFERRMEFSFPFPVLAEPRDVAVTLRSFEAEGEPFGCLIVEDISLRRSVERMKETLAALLVHDLKNPLAVVAGNLGLLSDDPGLAALPYAREALRDSEEATGRLHRMVLNLLDITRLETAGMALRRRDFRARDLLEAVVRSGHLPAAQHRFEVEADPTLALCGDEDVLRRALDNLVDNARRYARGRVVLRARADGATVTFEVEDDGPGVPPEMRARVFDRYASGSAGRTNFGLGLTFVALAARAHGGAVEVDSGEGGGARFRLTVRRWVDPEMLAA
ncbi:MAG: histidine kinase [Myxococcaceae bacterium]|nr:histidine kinase [Myxococcaceae bacterium]